jgi:hypothetical protein
VGDHCRKQIRDAVAAALAAMTSATYIKAGQVHPLDESQLPAALINTAAEDNEDLNKNAWDGRRTLTLTVAGHAQAEDVIDYLDTMAVEIEIIIAFGALPAWVKEATLISTEVELSGEGVTKTGVVRLEYRITYHVNAAAPDTPLS